MLDRQVLLWVPVHKIAKNKRRGSLSALFIAGLLLIANLGALRAVELSDPSASFYLSPSSSSVISGTNLSVELRLKVANDSTHSARAKLTYPADKMEVTSVNPSSAFSIPAENSYGNGTINTAYGSFAGISGDQLFATISFKMNAASGEANVIIDPIIDASNHSYVAGDASGTGANILKSVSNGTYSVTKAGNSSQTGPVSDQTGQNQVKRPADDIQDKTGQTSTSVNNSSSETKSTEAIESGADLAATDNAPAGIMDKIIVLLALPTLVLAAFAARAINRKYGKGRWFIPRIRRRRMASSRHETVADIAARIYQARPDSVNETVAEIAARINRKRSDIKNETVAELAARLRRKTKRKRGGRRPKFRRKRH